MLALKQRLLQLNLFTNNRRFRKRWRRPQILQFCGDDRRIRSMHVLIIRPRLSPYVSIFPTKPQDLTPSPFFMKLSIVCRFEEYRNSCASVTRAVTWQTSCKHFMHTQSFWHVHVGCILPGLFFTSETAKEDGSSNMASEMQKLPSIHFAFIVKENIKQYMCWNLYYQQSSPDGTQLHRTSRSRHSFTFSSHS